MSYFSKIDIVASDFSDINIENGRLLIEATIFKAETSYIDPKFTTLVNDLANYLNEKGIRIEMIRLKGL